MAIPHTVVTGDAKPAQPGWILFHGMRNHYWHWLNANWRTCCQSTRIVKPSDVLEWRPEPKGRWEVCPDCRRTLQREEQRAKAEAEANERINCSRCDEAVPPNEILDDLCYICRLRAHAEAQREPEVITAEPIHFPTPKPIYPTPKAPTVTSGQPTSHAEITNVLHFAKRHGFSYVQLIAFVEERLPNAPRYQKAILLNAEAQAMILADFPLWVETRNEERKRKAREALIGARANSLAARKHAAAAIQAKALSTFQSQHVTPAGNVERVMAAIEEVKQLILMLAEDVAKMKKGGD